MTVCSFLAPTAHLAKKVKTHRLMLSVLPNYALTGQGRLAPLGAAGPLRPPADAPAARPGSLTLRYAPIVRATC